MLLVAPRFGLRTATATKHAKEQRRATMMEEIVMMALVPAPMMALMDLLISIHQVQNVALHNSHVAPNTILVLESLN